VPFTLDVLKKQDSKQIKTTENTKKINITQKQQTMQKYSKNKTPWFSYPLWHSARKWDGLILQCFTY